MVDKLKPIDKNKKKIFSDELSNALKNEAIPKYYANGFISAMGTGDICLFLKQADAPVAIVNLSYTVAKSLALMLGSVIAELEKKSGNTIMTTDDINKLMSSNKKEE